MLSIEISEVYTNSKPVFTESIIALLISVMVISNYTVTDINFHDNYVVEVVAECHANNVSEFCEDLRKKYGCSRNDQMCLGKPYWQEQQRQVVWLGATLFIIRMSFG